MTRPAAEAAREAWEGLTAVHRALQRAVQASEWAYQTLANLVFVCGAIDFSRRRENLSFSHHAEVAALDPPEQERLLEAAEERGWSVRDTREAVRSYKRELERQGWPVE